LARALAHELGWPIFSSDRVRKEMVGSHRSERSSDAARSRLYSPALTEKTYEKLFAAAAAETRAGRSVVLDATFARRLHRQQLKERFNQQRVAFRFIEAQADDAVVKQRLREREVEPDEWSDARIEDFERLTGIYEPPAERPAHHCLSVRTDGPLTKTLTRALKALVQAQGETHPAHRA
jgi:predicted kinase